MEAKKRIKAKDTEDIPSSAFNKKYIIKRLKELGEKEGYNMFYYCSSLTSLNLSNNVNNMSYMFSGCSSLISLNTKDKKY